MNWEKHKLGSLVKVISGFAFKSRDFKSNGDIPVIKIKDIQKERVVISEEYFLDKSFLQIDKKFHCQKGDILISLTGSHITLPNSVVGRIAKYQYDKTSLLNQRAGKIIVLKENVLDNDFLYYYLCQEEIRTELALFGRGGANQVNISPKNVESIDVTIPPIEIQKRIADILSNYDDLIENNLKRISLLEQAAQNIYKEWFVNMRFPGHVSAEFDSETGLPEGWNNKPLTEFESFHQHLTKIRPFEGEKEYLATANVEGIEIVKRGELTDYANKPSRAQIQPPLNSVWFARMSNTYKILFFTESSDNNLMISSGFAGFRAKSKDALPFLYCLISSAEFNESKNNFATGSTQVSINNKSIAALKFIEPSQELILEFGKLTYDYLNLIQNLFNQNHSLRAARDILLPRLMNQTIEV